MLFQLPTINEVAVGGSSSLHTYAYDHWWGDLSRSFFSLFFLSIIIMVDLEKTSVTSSVVKGNVEPSWPAEPNVLLLWAIERQV